MLGLSPLLPAVFFPETFDRHAESNIVHGDIAAVCCGSDKDCFQNAVVEVEGVTFEIYCWWRLRFGRF